MVLCDDQTADLAAGYQEAIVQVLATRPLCLRQSNLTALAVGGSQLIHG